MNPARTLAGPTPVLSPPLGNVSRLFLRFCGEAKKFIPKRPRPKTGEIA